MSGVLEVTHIGKERWMKEMSDTIISAHKYDVITELDHFYLYTAEHSDGVCIGGVLWYKRTGSFAEDTAELHFDHKLFRGQTESDVYRIAATWVQQHFGADVRILPGTRTI